MRYLRKRSRTKLSRRRNTKVDLRLIRVSHGIAEAVDGKVVEWFEKVSDAQYDDTKHNGV